MVKKREFFGACLILSKLLLAFLGVSVVFGWSNGGYSADPAHPDYGTHDWIAEHALDWLPQQEKQFLLDNKAVYLYGTELPDNDQASDRINDKHKHHVYFFSNGSLQEDDAAIRARDEYQNALDLFNSGNRSEAAKRLGIMAHYIGDLAVFGHVMGEVSVWGAESESHHDNYEDYVQTRTNSYVDTFDSFLVFDGSLSTKTAYDTAVKLANDTTFDEDGDYTCVWMDTHYNWTDQAFRNRAGESLNFAVNAVADVLHTFGAEVMIPEFPSGAMLAVLLLVTLPVAVLVKRKNMDKKA